PAPRPESAGAPGPHHAQPAARHRPRGSRRDTNRGRDSPPPRAPWRPTHKPYGPTPLPAREKPPADTEFDEQNALDRWLFDLLGGWARNAGKKGDGRTAATLVDRASALPGLTGGQIAELNALRADLAWDGAQPDLATA